MDDVPPTFERDRSFLVRLVVVLVVGLVGGFFLFGRLTQPGVGSCAARLFRSATEPPQTPALER